MKGIGKERNVGRLEKQQKGEKGWKKNDRMKKNEERTH